MNISETTLSKSISIITLLGAVVTVLAWQINLARDVKRLEEYKNLTDKKIELLEKYNEKFNEKQKLVSNLSARIDYIEEVFEHYQMGNINQKISSIPKIEQKLGDINTLSQRLRDVENLIQHIDNVEHLEQKIAVLAKLDQQFTKVFNVDFNFEKLLDINDRLSKLEYKLDNSKFYTTRRYVETLENFIAQLTGPDMLRDSLWFKRNIFLGHIRQEVFFKDIPDGSIICVKQCDFLDEDEDEE